MDSERNVLVREYRTPWTYEREAQRLAAEGWHVVSLLERRPPRDWLHYATCGLVDFVRGPERLVTYAPATPAVAAAALAAQPAPAAGALAPVLSLAQVRRAARRAAAHVPVPDPVAIAGVAGQPATSLAA